MACVPMNLLVVAQTGSLLCRRLAVGRACFAGGRFMGSPVFHLDLPTAPEPERGGSGTGVPPVRFETNGRDARATRGHEPNGRSADFPVCGFWRMRGRRSASSRQFPDRNTGLESPVNPQVGKPALREPVHGDPHVPSDLPTPHEPVPTRISDFGLLSGFGIRVSDLSEVAKQILALHGQHMVSRPWPFRPC